MKMNKWLLFLIVFLAGFGIMELCHFALPLPVRFLTTPLTLLAAVTVYYFLLRPEKPWKEALEKTAVLLAAGIVLVLVMHGLLYRDLGNTVILGRLGYLFAFLAAAPWFGALVYTLFGKKKQ